MENGWKKSLIWLFLSTFLFGFTALINALFVVLFFNLSGVAVLAALGYWQIYWLLWAVWYIIAGPVAMALIHRDWRRNDLV